MLNYIGIDLGGTNLRIGKYDSELNEIEVIKFPSEAEKGTEQIIDKIVMGINQLKDEQTQKVGLCVPGQVDVETSTIIMLTNLNFENLAIGQIIKEQCGLETILNNDANLAGLGEAVLGVAKTDKLVYYITWSTGIGGALIVNKDLINGKNMCSGEIGNLIIHSNPDSYKHSFMNIGGLEGLASGTALKRYANELGLDNAGELIEQYSLKNPKAIEVIDFVCDTMARAITMIAHVVEVDTFVLGGGVTLKSGNILLPLVQEKLDQYLMPLMRGTIDIKVASLGDDAGIIGSAYLAKQSRG